MRRTNATSLSMLPQLARAEHWSTPIGAALASAEVGARMS
jgi:hypothetical protein